MTRGYLWGVFALVLLGAVIWTVRARNAVAPAELVAVSAHKHSAPTVTPGQNSIRRIGEAAPLPDLPIPPTSPIVIVSDSDSQASSGIAPTAHADTKPIVLSDDELFSSWLNALNAGDSEAFYAAFNRLGEKTLQRLILQRLQEIDRRADGGEPGAQRLQFMAIQMCTKIPSDANFPVDCPMYTRPEQIYEQAVWRALAQGVPEAYLMSDIFLQPKPSDDNYYARSREILLRQRQIYLGQIESGSCLALDWLGNTYGLTVGADSALADPRLAYRYRYAMTQLGAAPYIRMTDRMETALKPEIIAFERLEASKLVDRAFRNRPEHPSCKEYRVVPQSLP